MLHLKRVLSPTTGVIMRKSLTDTNLHTNIQRANGYAELVANVIPGSDLPVRVAQTLASTSIFFKKSSSKQERLINGLQALISIIGIGLQVTLMFTNLQPLVIALKALDLIYQGTLLGVWGQSELIRPKQSS